MTMTPASQVPTPQSGWKTPRPLILLGSRDPVVSHQVLWPPEVWFSSLSLTSKFFRLLFPRGPSRCPVTTRVTALTSMGTPSTSASVRPGWGLGSVSVCHIGVLLLMSLLKRGKAVILPQSCILTILLHITKGTIPGSNNERVVLSLPAACCYHVAFVIECVGEYSSIWIIKNKLGGILFDVYRCVILSLWCTSLRCLILEYIS